MPMAVTHGATLRCALGSAMSNLVVTHQLNDQIESMAAATIQDHKPGLNILPFGTCAALGGPCVPATPAPWIPGSTSLVIIDNAPALLRTDQLACAVGGMISIVSPGQSSTLDT